MLVCGGGYLRHEAGNAAERLAPDCLVAFGVNPDAIVARNGYVISEVGKPPDFVLEVASRSTGRRDYTVKRAGYARYGVGEYWRFDHTGGRYHDVALAGDRLVNEGYEPTRIEQRCWALDLCWERGESVRFYDPAAGEYLPSPAEPMRDQHAQQRCRACRPSVGRSHAAAAPGATPPAAIGIVPAGHGFTETAAVPNARAFGSSSRTRTCNLVVNSHPLYQLSYRGSPTT